MRTTREAVEALSRLTNYERTRPDGPRAFNVERTEALLERLGSPHRRLGARVVQVAGTKGKGSTTRFVDSIFRAAGLRTGRFLSPHIERIEERIALDGAPVAEAEFARRVGEALAAASGETTFFEAMLAAACLHFAGAGTDAVVLEVGLGGRLDATTAVPTTASVITEISFDHMDLLGDTLERIASEKAAIVRPGVPLITGVDPATGPGRVIREAAEARGAPYRHVPAPEARTRGSSGIEWNGITIPVLGLHQAHNAALAAAVAENLGPVSIRRGLESIELPAACERFGDILLDSAHNDASIRALLDVLDHWYPGVRPTLVFGISRDKEVSRLIGLLAPRVGRVFCAQADAQRGADARDLAAHPAWSDRAEPTSSPSDALRRATAAGGLVVVTGSVYLAGALRQRCRALTS